MILLKNPRSTLVTTTSVPNFLLTAWATVEPMKDCTIGMCNSITESKYSPTSDQITVFIIFLSRLKYP